MTTKITLKTYERRRGRIVFRTETIEAEYIPTSEVRARRKTLKIVLARPDALGQGGDLIVYMDESERYFYTYQWRARK